MREEEKYHRQYCEPTDPKSDPQNQIGCGYCAFENKCKLNAIRKENREAFMVNGITTAIIATNCKNFKHFNN
jgi:hypothetical protein